VLQRDARALIGLLAVLEGEIMASRLDAPLLKRVSQRFASAGMTANDASDRELRQALNNLNQRLQYAIGGYSDPPRSTPFLSPTLSVSMKMSQAPST